MLLVDQGNSFTKAMWYTPASKRLTPAFSMETAIGQQVIEQRIQSLLPHPTTEIRIASVAPEAVRDDWAAVLQARFGGCVHLAQSQTACDGLINGYQRPDTMGVDRWLAMLGAWQHEKTRGRAFAVIDIGTALTLDVVGADGTHRGGHIIPGLQLLKSCLLKTAKVRWDEESDAGAFALGTTTGEAVHFGCNTLINFYVHCVLGELVQQHGQLAAYLLGGGLPARIIESLTEKVHDVAIHHQPNLIFRGLAAL